MTISPFSPVRRGDIAVTSRTSRVYAMHMGSRVVCTLTVGVVTSVSRDGKIKRIKPLSNSCDMTPRDWDHVHVVEQGRVADMEGLKAACTARQSLEACKYDPWRDLNDVRTTLRKFAK